MSVISITKLQSLFLLLCIFISGDNFVSARGSSQDNEYYKIFGLDRNSFDKSSLKKSYYKLAKEFHPDKNPGNKEAEKKFKEITHAFEILNDDEKRKIYNLHGEEGIKGGFESDSGFSAQDIFERFFGGGGGGGGGFGFDFFGGGHGRQPRTSDVKLQYKVSLQDIYKGASLKFDINRQKICSVCDGHGTKDPNDVKVCSDCRGKGIKMVQKVLAPGFIQQFQTHCSTCSGQGKIFRSICNSCGGKKTRRQPETIEFDVPAGAPEGFVIKLPESADEAPDHTSGDIYVVIVSEEHKKFRRDGFNLHTTVELSLNEALYGFTKAIQHLDDHKVTLKRTDVTQPEFVVEIPKEGLLIVNEHGHSNGKTGSLFVKYSVKLPSSPPSPSSGCKKELDRMAQSSDYDEL